MAKRRGRKKGCKWGTLKNPKKGRKCKEKNISGGASLGF